jgi:hypothetical protein
LVSEKKSSSSKLNITTKILIVYLIKNSSLFYFLPKKWWSCDCFFIPASEAPKNFWGPKKRFKFWILDLKVCLKKLGIGSGWYRKSVLYLLNMELQRKLTFSKSEYLSITKIFILFIGNWIQTILLSKFDVFDTNFTFKCLYFLMNQSFVCF